MIKKLKLYNIKLIAKNTKTKMYLKTKIQLVQGPCIHALLAVLKWSDSISLGKHASFQSSIIEISATFGLSCM
jgi:hypothetical protein